MVTLSQSILDHATKLGADSKVLASDEADILAPEQPLDPKHPLSHYFISSSHNTYLWGHQLYGKASAEPYQIVLERACRCVEIDVWDGEELSSSESSSDEEKGKVKRPQPTDKVRRWRPDRVEPRVLHGFTATQECSFRDVVEAIGLYAFTKTDLPLIISLEVHTSHEQQEIMVEIMNEYWGSFLIDNFEWNEKTPMPDLDALRNKILIKVKYSPPDQAKATSGKDSEDESQSVSVTKGKIIPALGNMGLYTRSYHFTDFDQPEAKYPTHVFSMSEFKLSSVHAKDPVKLFNHNKDFIMRAYPKGTRVTSSNLDPAPFWRLGVQIAALNWQYVNEPMMLNHALFAGTGGYVLKPPGYRGATSVQRGTIDLTIEVFAGSNLGPPKKKLKAYVKCELHVEEEDERKAAGLPKDGEEKEGEYKAKTSTAKEGRDPDFKGQKLEFKGVQHTTEDLSFVRFKIMDDESFSKDDMVGWACYRFKRLREGVRVIKLFDEEAKETEGRLLVRVTKKFTPN
ncbi:1-phosphatidylinositol 4,5-bisphosphate phosphodiesterase 1 [Sphaceloma murrayae]|uniref:Phosphoinositide phospholipase C n=1 Tax=Sphaceloma murrayae TaxID=2082308 RepID=A0A2K1QTA1_9PEZI|nr:1-phosphatidylinositol 4,5-bisphosphate phosphodiesterase 1 [Sphaceloma murrayae]